MSYKAAQLWFKLGSQSVGKMGQTRQLIGEYIMGIVGDYRKPIGEYVVGIGVVGDTREPNGTVEMGQTRLPSRG